MSSSPNTVPQSVLVLGAGELGSAILAQLTRHPLLVQTAFTVLLRPSSLSNPARLAEVRAVLPPSRQDTLSFVGFDFASQDAQTALTRLIVVGGYDTVISCTGFATADTGDTDNGTQLLIAKAVFAAGQTAPGGGKVQRYFPWQFGVDYDIIGPHAARGLMAEQCAVRALLRSGRASQAGVEWTIVSVGMFMSFIFEEWFGIIEGLKGALAGGDAERDVVLRALGSWDTTLTLTDVEDIGKCVADVLATPTEMNDKDGRIVFVAAETITYSGLADIVGKTVAGSVKLRTTVWTEGYLREELEKEPDNKLKKYRVMFAEGKGLSWSKETTINAQRNIRTAGLQDYINRFRA